MKSKESLCSNVWEKVWAKTTIDEELAKLPKDEYFEHITKLVKSMPKFSLILKAGCGLGKWIFYLNDLGFQTIGIDMAKYALKSALEYAKKEKRMLV